MELFKNFKDFKMDVLKEVGNIGAGNAATALSQLLNKPIDMAVPKVQLLSFEEITDKVGGAEELVYAVFLRVEGEAPGNLFFILTPEAASSLLSRIAGIEVSGGDELSEMELSALSEIGNILAGSYLSSWRTSLPCPCIRQCRRLRWIWLVPFLATGCCSSVRWVTMLC